MRKVLALLLVLAVGAGFCAVLAKIPFGTDKVDVANHYMRKGVEETGAGNIVTSVVVTYRGFDTLGEVTILFIVAIGLGAVLFVEKRPAGEQKEEASLIVRTGSKVLFLPIILLGVYIFVHGHLTPGGGFQGGAVMASGFLLLYLAWPRHRAGRRTFSAVESLAGVAFVAIGLLGVACGVGFLGNFLPLGTRYALLSAGVIPIIYVAIGLKVGAELAGVVANLMERE
ncbi:MAG: cation:proton antiporter [Planctomycetes bacterium DG_20]|nr:MAG: cation:proton antiporter [Planctomycetes bacterium DG_20]